MTVNPGRFQVRLTCKTCARVVTLWLDSFPMASRTYGDLTEATKAKLCCTSCGALGPHVYVRWEPKADRWHSPH